MRLAFLAPGRRPVLIWLGAPLLVLLSLSALVFWALILVDQTMAPGSGSTEFAGITLSGVGQHLAVTPIVLLVIGGQGALGYGLLLDRGWTRPLAVLYWTVAGVLVASAQVLNGVPWEGPVTRLAWGFASSALAWLYFYRVRGVRRYYGDI